MKKLLPYLGKYKIECVLAPLFKMLEAVFELIVPLVVASIIDNGIAAGDRSFILSRAGILVALAVVGMAVSITAQFFAAKAAAYFGRDLRQGIFDKIQSLSFSELDEVGTSTLITRITADATQVQNGVNLVLRLLLRSPFIVVGTIIMSFTIDFKCALIFLITVIILSLIIYLIMNKTLPQYKKIQSELDGVTLATRENLSGARVIRAFVCEENEVSRFKERNRRLASFQKAAGRISALLNPLTYVIINFAIIALIYLGGYEVNSGQLTQGEVVALYNYMSQILIELLKLANLIITVTRAMAGAGRISEILKLESTLQSNNNSEISTDNAVDFQNVSFRYKNACENSLSKISFSAKRGSVVGVIGSTGSGKSSLVSLIAHFYDATEGVVRVDGVDVKAYDKDALRSKIGFVLQKSTLFSGTVRENLLWGKTDADDSELYDALKTAQIYDAIMEKDGLDSKVYQNGNNFSGGQLQRLSIARALVRKPEILIFDDSWSALDFATEAKLKKEIFSLDYNPTIFIVSQRASSVLNADEILVLEDGELAAAGSHSRLLQECEIYKEIYYSQYEKGAAM
ncbi:MAG: ABC transporter ATP-binding protein/permease [Clostridiales bacterium]|nr:ABC transporter ATP-binding protein/permease [Clostridiales bacterium]